MKTIIVCCGAASATSAILEIKVRELLEREGIEAKVIKTYVSAVPEMLKEKKIDLVIPSGKYQFDNVPVISGMPYITGIGIDKLERQIIKELTE